MFAAIYIPDFPVQALVRLDPALRERAVAVLEGKPPLLRVIAMNERAAELGIEASMTKLQAEVYGVELRVRSRAQETAAHAALLDCAQAFSPRVEDTAADTLLLDIAGLERLFGPLFRLAQELVQRATEVGLEANVATAANPDAARHAALGFSGVTVIPPGKEAERLGELPIDVLLTPANGEAPDARELETLETLDRWGVRTLRALGSLPEVAIAERLGQAGLAWQKLARGTTSRPLVPSEPALEFEEAMELEHPVALLEPLAFILGRLLEQVCARLGTRTLATNELRLRLELDPADTEDSPWRYGDTEAIGSLTIDSLTNGDARPSFVNESMNQSSIGYERRLRLPLPMLDSKLFLKLLQLELKAHPPVAPVVKAVLRAEPAPRSAAQSGLFAPLEPEPQRLELTLARLRSGAGDERVGAAELLDTNRPQGFRMTRFAPAAPGLKPLSSRDRQDRTTLAFRVFRPPLKATVEIRGGEPAYVAATGIRGELVSVSGPWRSSGEWWKEETHHRNTEGTENSKAGAWVREEWDVALRDKDTVMLYRIYCNGEWFVEGTYD